MLNIYSVGVSRAEAPPRAGGEVRAHLSRLGVVDVAVGDGLRQLHDPVVDLVPAPALNCCNNNNNNDIISVTLIQSRCDVLRYKQTADLRCAALAACRLWSREELPASWKTRQQPNVSRLLPLPRPPKKEALFCVFCPTTTTTRSLRDVWLSARRDRPLVAAGQHFLR